PGLINTAGETEHIVAYFVEPWTGHDAADLCFFTESEQVGQHIEMFTAPVAACKARAALDLVENQQHAKLVRQLTEFAQPFAAEMIVAALALDRLDDDGRDVQRVRFEDSTNRHLAFAFAHDDVGGSLRFWQGKIDGGCRHPRPIELREMIRLTRVGVGEAECVTAAAVESACEVKDFRASLTMAGREIA